MRWFVTALSIVVALVGPFGAAVPGVVAIQDSSPAATAADLPATPVGDQLAWLITLLSGGTEPPTEEDVASHFTTAALAELPPSMIIGVAQQFAEAFGPFTYQGPARPATPNQLIGYLTGRDEVTFLVVVATDASPPHQLTGAALLPIPSQSELPAVAPESLSGQLNVGGRELFLSCSGTGDPTSSWRRATGIVAACGRRFRTELPHVPAFVAMTGPTSRLERAIRLPPRAPRKTRWRTCTRC